MVVRLEISDALERKLVDRARSTGQDANQYVHGLLERDLTAPTLDEVLKPLRDQVEKLGMSEDELDALVDQARDARFRRPPGKSS